MPTQSPYDVVVLGAGILGLATADALTTAGLRVAIVARDLPEDLDSAAFASPWAGANWSSFASNEKERRRDTITFETFGKLAESHPSIVRRTPFKYVWDEDIGYSNPWYRELVGGFRPLEPSERSPAYKDGVSFQSFTVNPPHLLAHLAAKLRAAGVPLVRRRVATLDEAFNTFGEVSFVVNATGLGARSLLGVEDPAVHPVRGQTVVAYAPGVQTCFGVRDKNLPAGVACYIIPRPGSDGCVILGGTNWKDDYSTLAHRPVAERILENAYRVCPELAGPHGKSWRDIKIVSHNVGLRPSREGGLRLEVEERTVEPAAELQPLSGARQSKRDVAVLHCYGIGPAGYQASFGVADEAKDLTLAYLSKAKHSAKL